MQNIGKKTMSPFSRISSPLGIFMLFVFLASCQFSNQVLSERISQPAKDFLLQRKDIQESESETIHLLGNSLVVFSIFASKKVPKNISQQLQADFAHNIINLQLFQKVLAGKKLEEFFKQNRAFNQSKAIYLDSLVTVSVSDKDISNPLGKFLDSENILVFQVDRWPCQDCMLEKEMRMKLRIVDAESGYIVWTGINEKTKLSEDDMGNLDVIAQELSDELLNSFYHRFKRKWHRKRFSNLALLVNI